MLALTRAKISKFDKIALNEYVFGFDVAVEDALSVHELDGSEYLEHVELDFLEG
jgi:hypothetical protein